MDHSKEEYELQHFNFSVRQFKEESNKFFFFYFRGYVFYYFCLFLDRMFIEGTVSTMVKKLLEVFLEKRILSPEIPIDKIRKAIKNNILKESVDILKQFDEKIIKSFTIPKNVYLPEDYIQKYKYTSEDEQNLQDTYNELKNRYTHVRSFQIYFFKNF